MRYFRKLGFQILMLSLVLAGCSIHNEILPTYDEVLIYDLPYDLTFLRSVEAIESIEGWDLEVTEKEKGIIQVRNVNYSRFDDSDRRMARIWVDRKDRFQTKVQLAPESQQVIGAGELLERISQYLRREM